ncbi:MAG: beta-glucosidase [Ktedonobacterales bacterium]|nr:beta-glucosidase [Ktedonobacterales bacterium]
MRVRLGEGDVFVKERPARFIWGVATSAYQIEGAATEDGRGESIWDRFQPMRGGARNDTGQVACDHYHRYRADIALMQRLGVDAYRFSVAWPRIFPEGVGRLNAPGLDFYDRLVDTLLAAGIRPFVTLFHYDLPQALQDRWGGWAGRDTVAAFAAYAEAVSRRLGDRVADWITLNQPWCPSWLGYVWGVHAPGIKDLRLGLQVAHHLLLGHGSAVPILRQNSAGARVGIALNLGPVYPDTSTPADRAAATLADGTYNRWFLDALFKGSYPPDVLAVLGDRAPRTQAGDMEIIRAELDFLGVNYYTRSFWKAAPGRNSAGIAEVRREDVERTAMDCEIYSEGLYEVLVRVQREYAPPRLYITESGAAFDDTLSAGRTVADERRIAYLRAHFHQARRAIAHGVPLQGYFVWSLMDNFEWAEGYRKRFGLVYVDYATQERILKDSAKWFARMLRGRADARMPAHLMSDPLEAVP